MTDMSETFDLLVNHVLDPGSSWSVGSFGAIAEFMRDADEDVDIRRSDDAISAATGRGGIRLMAWPGLRPVAYETATAKSASWSQAVAVCLPQAECAMAGREVLTEIGPDAEALRDVDRGAILFDLGLDQKAADICIRTPDAGLIETLRAAAGRSLFEPGNPAMPAILTAGPHRVFISRFARCEVFQPIPLADGKSPVGPHTHILPKLLKSGQSHAATAPIPEGWVPATHLFPAHAAKDALGHAKDFEPERHEAFQTLLARYGLPGLRLYKQRVLDALGDGRPVPAPSDRFEKASLRATLAQWRLQGGHPPAEPDDAPGDEETGADDTAYGHAS